MAPKYDSIASLNASKENWNVMVRVVRLWFVKDLATNKPPFSMEMVFMDKNVSFFLIYFHELICLLFLIFFNDKV
jgi:hypothetical protein